MLSGLWNWAGSTVSGGLNAIGNVWKGITGGVTNFTSSFFPASQKVSTISNVTAAGGATPNLGYRAGILPQMSSIAEKYVSSGPETKFTPSAMDLGKLTAEQYISVQPEVIGASISKPGGLQGTIDQVFAGMKAATENIGTFKTLADSLAGIFKKHEPITEGPNGTVVTNIEPSADMSSSVGTYLTNMNQVVSDMVKGLFNLGYSGPQGAQPTVAVQGEYAKTTNYTGLLIVAALVVGLIWLVNKK